MRTNTRKRNQRVAQRKNSLKRGGARRNSTKRNNSMKRSGAKRNSTKRNNSMKRGGARRASRKSLKAQRGGMDVSVATANPKLLEKIKAQLPPNSELPRKIGELKLTSEEFQAFKKIIDAAEAAGAYGSTNNEIKSNFLVKKIQDLKAKLAPVKQSVGESKLGNPVALRRFQQEKCQLEEQIAIYRNALEILKTPKASSNAGDACKARGIIKEDFDAKLNLFNDKESTYNSMEGPIVLSEDTYENLGELVSELKYDILVDKLGDTEAQETKGKLETSGIDLLKLAQVLRITTEDNAKNSVIAQAILAGVKEADLSPIDKMMYQNQKNMLEAEVLLKKLSTESE